MADTEKKSSENESKTWLLIIAVFLAAVIIAIVIWLWYDGTNNGNNANPGNDAVSVSAKAATSISSLDKKDPKNIKVKNAITGSKHHQTVKQMTSSGLAPAPPRPKTGKVSAFDAATSGSSTPLTPQQVLAAYGGTPDGKGQSIAIVVAYNYPSVQQDLNDFCTAFSLPQKQLIIHNVSANSAPNDSWAIEANLDTQYATLMAPNADIHVVFAASDAVSDLRDAVILANSLKPNIISMSWGIDETVVAQYSLQSLLEDQFSSGASFYLAASGDNLSVSYPSTSNNVVAVGGTTLVMNGLSRAGEYPWSEAGDSGGGKGISQLFPRPSYQANCNSSQYKMAPDVSLVANTPAQSGVMVCHSGNILGVGGTSLSCPLLAGLIATSLSVRAKSSKTPLTQSGLLNYIYSFIQPNSPCSPLEGPGAVNNKFLSYLNSL
jgi:subtilase family serine protease